MSATFTTNRVAETAALRGTADALDDLLGDRGFDAYELVAEYSATRREAQKQPQLCGLGRAPTAARQCRPVSHSEHDVDDEEVITVSTNPQPIPAFNGSDRVDLDELFREARPVGDGSDLAAPGVFDTPEELDEFLAWLRADRAAGLA